MGKKRRDTNTNAFFKKVTQAAATDAARVATKALKAAKRMQNHATQRRAKRRASVAAATPAATTPATAAATAQSSRSNFGGGRAKRRSESNVAQPQSISLAQQPTTIEAATVNLVSTAIGINGVEDEIERCLQVAESSQCTATRRGSRCKCPACHTRGCACGYCSRINVQPMSEAVRSEFVPHCTGALGAGYMDKFLRNPEKTKVFKNEWAVVFKTEAGVSRRGRGRSSAVAQKTYTLDVITKSEYRQQGHATTVTVWAEFSSYRIAYYRIWWP